LILKKNILKMSIVTKDAKKDMKKKEKKNNEEAAVKQLLSREKNVIRLKAHGLGTRSQGHKAQGLGHRVQGASLLLLGSRL
jgi:hypothetical protein